MKHSFFYIALGLFSSLNYNSGQAQQIKTAEGNPFLPAYNQVIDFAEITPANIQEATRQLIEKAKESNKRIVAAEGKRTFENTLAEFDNGDNLLSQAASTYEVVFSASPDKAIRDAASAAYQEINNMVSAQAVNEDLYKAVKAYSLTPEAKALTGERKYFLHHTLRNFERDGFALSKEKRDTLKNINDKLLDLSLKFGNNIAQDNPTIVFNEAEMDGLSEDYRRSHRQSDGTYKMDVSNPSYMPFMNYAKNTEARKRFYLLKMNVAAPQNDELLNEILSLRTRKAKILGHESYADYVTEAIMSKNKKNVWDFEKKLAADLRPKAEQEYKELLALKSKASGKAETVIYPYESSYYSTRLLDEKYQVDDQKIKEYFELQNVIKGLFEVYQRIYNLSFVEDKHPSVWSEDVQAFTVTDNASKKTIGYFYLDLYPRDNKYKHAACFPITAAARTKDGRSIASAALICNFPKPSPEQPSLMPHSQVQTIFHEFGHLMHCMVSETELYSTSGTNVVTDFVEAPSQIMENWVWNKEVLSLFAKHYKTGQVIPNELVDKMIASRNAISGLTFLQQVFYGTVDFTLNDNPGINSDRTIPALVKQLQNSITLYPFVDGSHFEAGFGHLTNYGSQYYGYLWSLVYASDMYSVFAANPLSPALGHKFREQVLAKGGSDDALNLVKNFLGREPNNKAFLKNLGIGKK
ncbi:MAG TPA: M3 family metallopeptidase [Bacteroidia bacterium]|jgi:thimet oligopeptidase|nr:M3 family metallopeptidase [Bacteroidia bacterium]